MVPLGTTDAPRGGERGAGRRGAVVLQPCAFYTGPEVKGERIDGADLGPMRHPTSTPWIASTGSVVKRYATRLTPRELNAQWLAQAALGDSMRGAVKDLPQAERERVYEGALALALSTLPPETKGEKATRKPRGPATVHPIDEGLRLKIASLERRVAFYEESDRMMGSPACECAALRGTVAHLESALALYRENAKLRQAKGGG